MEGLNVGGSSMVALNAERALALAAADNSDAQSDAGAYLDEEDANEFAAPKAKKPAPAAAAAAWEVPPKKGKNRK